MLFLESPKIVKFMVKLIEPNLYQDSLSYLGYDKIFAYMNGLLFKIMLPFIIHSSSSSPLQAQFEYLSQQDNVEFHRQSDGLQPSASTAKLFEGTLPQSASNVKIPEPCSNFFKVYLQAQLSHFSFFFSLFHRSYMDFLWIYYYRSH